MKTISEIFNLDRKPEDIIADLSRKTVSVPGWEVLRKEYDPKLHPVNDKSSYRDRPNSDGTSDKVTRITYDLQRLATKRMTELCFSIPVQRLYHSTNDKEVEASKLLETIYQRNRIDSVNKERGVMLFAGCEVMTLWYAVRQENNNYGVKSKLKLRCRNFSPMKGDILYPLFDDYGDYIAMSVKYDVVEDQETKTTYFDTYTDSLHIKWMLDSVKGWQMLEYEEISIQKNPTLYMYRPSPIWEDTSSMVYEMEWSMSRNGNYLRKNSKPIFGIFSDEAQVVGKEKNENSEFRSIVQFPAGSDARYLTWEQATENLKFYIAELRQMFFTQLQLPDWSYYNLREVSLSGEALKRMFVDAQMKVGDESGRLVEFLDREMNVVKAFAKIISPELAEAIDALQVETLITPYNVSDDKETISNIMTATGGKPIMSQFEGIKNLGWSDDPEATMNQIISESATDAMEPTL